MNKFQPKIADFGCEIVDAISNGLTAETYTEKILESSNQGGIKGEGALPSPCPAQLFLTASSPKFQIPDSK